MQSNEIEQLKERLFQKEQLLLSSRSGLAMTVIDHFGEEAEEVIKNFLNTFVIDDQNFRFSL